MTAQVTLPDPARTSVEGWTRAVSARLVPELVRAEPRRLRLMRANLVSAVDGAQGDEKSDALQGAVVAFTTVIDAWSRYALVQQEADHLKLAPDTTTTRLLEEAVRNPGLPQQALARKARTSSEVASRRGGVLERSGLITRRRAGKERHWTVTPRGRRALALLSTESEDRPDSPRSPISSLSGGCNCEPLPTVGVLKKNLRTRGVPDNYLRHFRIDPKRDEALSDFSVAALSRVYGNEIGFAKEPELVGAIRFKRAKNARPESAETLLPWLTYCGRTIVESCPDLKAMEPPHPSAIREQLDMWKDGPVQRVEQLASLLWSAGFIVLPTRFSSRFDGAFFEHQGRGVVIVNQQKQHLKWLNTVLHEIGHATQSPTEPIAEAFADAWATDPNLERGADRYAVEAVIGETEGLVEEVLRLVAGGLEKGKAARFVARHAKAPKEAVAWHAAMELKARGEDAKGWFSLATRFDYTEPDPLTLWHDALRQRLQQRHFSEVDVSLLGWWLNPIEGDPL